MKTIVGIDNQGAYPPAIQLLSALQIKDLEVTLLHAVNPVAPFVPLGLEPSLEVQSEYRRVIENLGIAALQEAKTMCSGLHMPVKTQMVYGMAAESICTAVDQTGADLVSVATHERHHWHPSFVASVSRGLTISCHASVLSAKGPAPTGRKLRAVLATDHSDYSTRWIDRFLAMPILGISDIHVMTAYSVDDHEAEILHRNLPALGGMVETWIEDRLEARNIDLLSRLTEHGYIAKGSVVRGEANESIRNAMAETEADLLIVGAQGHGFIERLFIGSVSLHQAVYEPYSVLIVRA